MRCNSDHDAVPGEPHRVIVTRGTRPRRPRLGHHPQVFDDTLLSRGGSQHLIHHLLVLLQDALLLAGSPGHISVTPVFIFLCLYFTSADLATKRALCLHASRCANPHQTSSREWRRNERLRSL